MIKKILHISVGSPYWEPSDEDLKSVAALFQEAIESEDPQVVVATRSDIQIIGEYTVDSNTKVLTINAGVKPINSDSTNNENH